MVVPRITLLQWLIFLAIVGLLCSVPLQCQRAASKADCQLVARLKASRAQELTIIADDAAPWLDGFRLVLRRLAAILNAASQRLGNAGFYDQAEEERISTQELATLGVNLNQFWSRFNAAATGHGYVQPKLGPRVYETGIVSWLADCWPTFVAIAVLGGVFRLIPRRRAELGV